MPRFVILGVRGVGVNRAQMRVCPIVSYAIGLVQARIEALWRLRVQFPAGRAASGLCRHPLHHGDYKASECGRNEQAVACSLWPGWYNEVVASRLYRMATGGDTVSTEAVATRRHAGGHLPVIWWKLELPTTTWHLLLN